MALIAGSAVRAMRGRVGVAILAAGVGAAAMYMLDPDRGSSRRARVRDKFASLGNSAGDLGDRLEGLARDLGNRAGATVTEFQARFSEGPIGDQTLEQRVRAELGRVASHPRNLIVSTIMGKVTLSGPILLAELPTVLAAVRGMRGVREVDNRMEVHETAWNVPSLQPD